MKKLFSILALAMVIGVFSSCVIVTHEEPTYTITFYNDLPDSSRNDIFDWYAKNDAGKNFAVSSHATHVSSGGGSSKLRSLPKDYYSVIFTLDDTTDSYGGAVYYESELFYLDRDRECTVKEVSRDYIVTVRSANNIVEEKKELEKGFQIVDSVGNVYLLKKVEK